MEAIIIEIFAFNHYGNCSTVCVQVQVTIPHISQIPQKPSAGTYFLMRSYYISYFLLS
ncbi:MAG: hypothetical protein KGD63_09920 [Candidatus Lokiarchaeota archaeon]|nr:hypothetical protein [Candidatus Lokiarchaeota archaeon]